MLTIEQWWEDQVFEELFNMSREAFESWIPLLPYVSLPGAGLETFSLLESQAAGMNPHAECLGH